MSHNPSKEVGEPEPVDSTPELLDKSQQPQATKSLAKLHHNDLTHVGGQSEHVQSASESSNAEHGHRPTPPRSDPAKLVRSTATYFDRSSIAAQLAGLDIDDKSPSARDPIMSLQQPSNDSEVSQAESCDGSKSVKKSSKSRGKSSSVKANKPRYYSNLASEDGNQEEKSPMEVTSLLKQNIPRKPEKSTRYYSWALSKEDKEALAVGEKSHDQKAWTAKDLVRFQESRLELVPRGIENRDAVIEKLNKDKEKAEQYLLRTDKNAAQSTPDHRASDAPNPLPFLIPLPLSQPSSPSSPVSPMAYGERTHHARNFSVGDYFSLPSDRRPERPGSTTSSGHFDHASHFRSPLSKEFIFEPRPDVTFDSFLEPHVSGKGEVYRRSKKDDQPGDQKDSVDLGTVEKPKKKQSKRMSKMPSMPSLRVRKSRGDIRGPVDE